MPKIVKRRTKPAPRPAVLAGPPRLVIVEMLDLTPAADGRTVIARTRTVPETASGQVVEEWSKAKGYRVRVVDQRTPEGEKYVYAKANRFKGADRCQVQPSSSSEATSGPSGSPTSSAASASPSNATTVPKVRPVETPSTSKARPSARSPQPSSRPSSSPKTRSQALSPRGDLDSTKLPSRSAAVGSTSSGRILPPKTSRPSGRSSGSSNGKSGNKARLKSSAKPTAASRQPANAVKATKPKTISKGPKPTPTSQQPAQGTSRLKPGPAKATTASRTTKVQSVTTPRTPSVPASSPAVAAVKLF